MVLPGTAQAASSFVHEHPCSQSLGSWGPRRHLSLEACQRFVQLHSFASLGRPERLLLCLSEPWAQGAFMITIEHLHFTYDLDRPHPVPALRDVCLHIDEGEYVVIIGRNGSGKSTLAKHLNALLLPTEGDVWIEGKNTKDPQHLATLRHTVGMVFQVPDNQLVATVVEEDVAFGPENMGVPRGEIEERVNEALDGVDMIPHRHRPPHMLSAGQKQRVAIAGVMAMRPSCLVLDEATAMLDPQGRREVLGIVRQLSQQGVTIVAITHFMWEAVEGTRVLVMDEGTIAMDGPPREVFGQPARLLELGLDVPPVTQLAQRLHQRQPALPYPLLTVQELADELCGLPRPAERRT